jgi:2-polyprenyl-6-hydroxyphenyl methylase/3-demethylubiquinone-9 3-methyltransferase
MLHWIARSRGSLVPVATRTGAVLVDVGCGAGLLAPHIAGKGYHHVGVDLTTSALVQARAHEVLAINGDVLALPLADATADVVCAGEIFEHVTQHRLAITEACRVLRPGGLLIIDTIAATWLARLLAIEIAERIPGGAPRGIHDPKMFVNRRQLIDTCAEFGVTIKLNGLRPEVFSTIGWLRGRRTEARMVNTRLTTVLFQGIGTKEI